MLKNVMTTSEMCDIWSIYKAYNSYRLTTKENFVHVEEHQFKLKLTHKAIILPGHVLITNYISYFFPSFRLLWRGDPVLIALSFVQ